MLLLQIVQGLGLRSFFAAHFSVNGTNQFDRTAEIQLADTMIYIGTTQEPSATEQPSWHVESDLTDDRALLRSSHPGTVELGNTVNAQDNGVETVSAYLELFSADLQNPARRDLVVQHRIRCLLSSRYINHPFNLRYGPWPLTQQVGREHSE
jgi:hypothetical protein